MRLFVVFITCLVCATTATEECGSLEGPDELDLSRWTVRSSPDLESARQNKSFGRVRVTVSADDEVFSFPNAIVEGIPWNQPLKEDRYRLLREKARLRSGDVVVATYPKFGTTWTEQIVLLLQHGSRAAPRLRPSTQNAFSSRTQLGKVWLEPLLAGRVSRPPEHLEQYPSPRLVKSHAPFHMLAGVGPNVSIEALESVGVKVVYVARNLKDAAVSHFFQRAPSAGERRMPMDAWLAIYLDGAVANGLVFDHLATWRAVALKSTAVLFITYEELSRRPIETVGAIAAHLGLVKSRLELQAIVNASSFEAMRGTPKVASLRHHVSRSPLVARFGIPPGGRPGTEVSFASRFRTGKVGAWRGFFNRRLSDQFDAIYRERMPEAWRRAAITVGLDPNRLLPPPRFDFGCGVVM